MSRRRLPTPRAPTLRAIAASSRATSLRAPRSRAASSRTRRSVAARSRTPASSFSDATRMAACSAAIVSARARRPASSARSRSLSTQTSQDTARRSPIREMWRSSARCESWDPVTRDAPTAITCNAVSPPAVGGQIYGAAACIGLGDVASNADGSRSASAPRPVARARDAGTDVLLARSEPAAPADAAGTAAGTSACDGIASGTRWACETAGPAAGSAAGSAMGAVTVRRLSSSARCSVASKASSSS